MQGKLLDTVVEEAEELPLEINVESTTEVITQTSRVAGSADIRRTEKKRHQVQRKKEERKRSEA